jgi:hypothetical protein
MSAAIFAHRPLFKDGGRGGIVAYKYASAACIFL